MHRDVSVTARRTLALPLGALALALCLGGAPRPAAGSSLVRVRLVSDPPGAELRVNGRRAGQTPSTLTLPPGTLELELRRDGYELLRRSVRIVPRPDGTVQEVALRLIPVPPATGVLLVRSSAPGTSCRVVLDGAEVGETPWEGDGVAPGAHVLSGRRGERESPPVEVQVEPGARHDVALACPAERTPDVPTTHGDGVGPAGAEKPAASVAFHLAFAVAEGGVFLDGDVFRSHVELELNAGLVFLRLDWLALVLGAAATVEAPVSVILRPGVRFELRPVYFRAAAQLVATPGFQGGVFVGLGAELPFSGSWYGFVEADVSVWPAVIELVELQGRLGVRYAF